MIYEQNLIWLEKLHSDIYKKIMEPDFSWDAERAQIEYARNGEPVLVYRRDDGSKEYLSSRYNPTREADKYMEDVVDLPERATLILIGFGNGAHIREFISKSKKNRTNCIVYEPSKDIFMRILHDEDISDILEEKRVHIVVNGINDRMAGIYADIYIYAENQRTNKHISLPKYQQLFPGACEGFLDIIKFKYENIEAEKNTARVYGERTSYNGIQNLCYLPGCYSSASVYRKVSERFAGNCRCGRTFSGKKCGIVKESKGTRLDYCS